MEEEEDEQENEDERGPELEMLDASNVDGEKE